jgi:hypothetical protein
MIQSHSVQIFETDRKKKRSIEKIKSNLDHVCASLLEKLSQYRSMAARFILAIAPNGEVRLTRPIRNPSFLFLSLPNLTICIVILSPTTCT